MHVCARACVLGHPGNHKGTGCGFSRLLTVDSNYALLHNTDDWRRAQNVPANDNQMEPGGGQEGMSIVWATLGAGVGGQDVDLPIYERGGPLCYLCCNPYGCFCKIFIQL